MILSVRRPVGCSVGRSDIIILKVVKVHLSMLLSDHLSFIIGELLDLRSDFF